MRPFLVAGAVFLFLAVALGAFGAHALRERISADMMAVYQTGVQYQTLHGLALLVLGFAAPTVRSLRAAGWLFTVGILIFSGSLYALALSGVRALGAITPIGGLCFLSGWLAVIVFAARKN